MPYQGVSLAGPDALRGVHTARRFCRPNWGLRVLPAGRLKGFFFGQFYDIAGPIGGRCKGSVPGTRKVNNSPKNE
jgi:hypothetical protein